MKMEMKDILYLLWQNLLPQLTWLYLYVLLTVPACYRLATLVSLWLIPLQFTYKRNSFGRWILTAIAKIKGLKVQRSLPDLPLPSTPAVYAFHPHGRCPFDIYAYLSSSEDTSSIVMTGSSIGRFIPSVVLPMALYSNNIDATKADMMKALQRGKQIGLFPGGAREMHECYPGSDKIAIVQHNGFLRLARTTNADVVPCFLFGMNDSYDTPFKRLQKFIYLYTKVSIPFWFPSLLRKTTFSDTNTLVLGKTISPAKFPSDEEFIDFYWDELEKLFEANKEKYPTYKKRRICFSQSDTTSKVQVGLTVGARSTISGFRKSTFNKFSTKQGQLQPRLVSILKFAVMLNVIVVMSSISVYLMFGKWWRFSLDVEYKNLPKMFHVHLISGILWTVVLIHNFFIKTGGWRHRLIGYVGIVSVMALFFSGVSMQLDVLVEAKEKLERHAEDGLISLANLPLFINTCIQTLSFLLVAEVSFFLTAFSIKSARRRQIHLHRTTMSMLHLLLADMAVPRLTAFLFRYFLPWIDRSTALSLACILQAGRHVQLMRARANYMVPINYVAACLSVTIATSTWLSSGELAVHSSVAGAVLMITLGVLIELEIPGQ
jgi:hypothetical protein